MGKKKELIRELEITDLAAEGFGIGRNNGKVVFVPYVAPGDIVDVQPGRNRKKFQEGRAIKFHKHSEIRTRPFCEHFGTCGGCKWQHIPYEQQAAFKEQQVKDQLSRLSTIELPHINSIITAPEEKYYRNKLEYTFSNQRWLTTEEIQSGEKIERRGVGFHIPKMFDKILDLNECFLQDPISSDIRNSLKEFALKSDFSFYNVHDHKGLLRNLIIRNTTKGDLMVIVQFGEDQTEQIKSVMDFLSDRFPEITSLFYVINLKKNETFHDQELILYKGEPFIKESLGETIYQIGPKSFFQTNSKQAKSMYDLVLEYAELSGSELVYDLYTGTGTIANYLAKHAKKVVGVEYVPEAIEDAKINSEINGITNTSFFSGDMAEVLNDDFVKENGKPDLIITDPPRAGMHEKVIKSILDVQAEKIIYVSCNPATQARDLTLLDEKYSVKIVQPIDMFPHTQHVECVVLLQLRD
ncbi:MAG: 23S rRNA (uracil(1939)-C(5))-methyltransferase RlmD [Bacteroidota bacterium]